MGKVMSSVDVWGTFSIVFKRADITELCIQLARLIGGLVTLLWYLTDDAYNCLIISVMMGI